MRKARAAFAAALVVALAIPAGANPSLQPDIDGMSQWLADQMAQGLAFNAGENFDPPKEIKGYYLQPDVSFGVGLIPFNKKEFPQMQTPELQNGDGAALFPNSTLFPNLALHLRMGLPWRGDFYLRFADATTPPGYRISPTMTAQVQTNSFGFGIRQHLFGGEDQPELILGAHYNHIQGYTKLKGTFGVNADGFTANDEFNGDIVWNISSFGLTSIVSQTFDRWTPFGGIGYNYATGSAAVSLDLQSGTFLVPDINGGGSDRPEENQGRLIGGISYDRETWSFFANGELKAIGEDAGRSWIIQLGAALPFDIGRTRTLISRRHGDSYSSSNPALDEDSTPSRYKPATRPRATPTPPETAPSEMIFLK